jgi:hypothetical protein
MAQHRPPVGSVFLIPLSDGGQAVGQVTAYEPAMLNSVSCILTSLRTWAPGVSIPESSVIASLFTTYDLLTNGRWEILGNAAIPITQADLPYERLRSAGWVGAKMTGSRNVEAFVNAWFGLAPWDDWADPNYLDRLLFRGVGRPATATFKEDQTEQVFAPNRSLPPL